MLSRYSERAGKKIWQCVLGSFIKLSEKFTLQGGIEKSLQK